MMKFIAFLILNFVLIFEQVAATPVVNEEEIPDSSIPEQTSEKEPLRQYYWPQQQQQQQGFYPNGRPISGGQYYQYPIQYPGQYPANVAINSQYPPYGQNNVQYPPVPYPGQYGQYAGAQNSQQFLPNSQGFSAVPVVNLVTLNPTATAATFATVATTPLPLQPGVSTTFPLGAGNGFQRPTNQNLYPSGGGVSGGNSQNIFPGQPGFGSQYPGYYQG